MRELQPEALRRLSKHSFERFCQRLLEVEYEARFEPRAVEIESASGEDIGDGGRDLRAIVKRGTTEKTHWDLLPDQPSDAWYSCKTHKDDGRTKDPGGWRKQVRDNLDPSPRLINDKKGELVEDADEIAKNKRAPPDGLLSALANGGRYVVLVNVRAERQEELVRGLRALFEFWIQSRFDSEESLSDDAVLVRDASYLARVFNTRPFALPPDIERELTLEEPRFLRDWARWTTEYTKDRRDMKWVPDPGRKALAMQIRAFLASKERAPVFRLWGPPGVGKTRLVHQVIDDAEVEDRVRFSENVREVRGWLSDAKNAVANDLILVVDEVAPTDAAGLARDFQAHAPKTARLIMVGPQELGHQGQPEPAQLERLDEPHTRQLLTNEMSPNDTRIDVALVLCRGYPLFAYWLGRALAEDPELLADPRAALTDDEDPWDATCAVLVGPPRGRDLQAWRDQATRRGKALLLASLTTEHAWSRLLDDERDALAAVLTSSWPELEAAAVECESRSLLRKRNDLRYVSPANLERLVLNHFFSDKGPGGPPLDPKRLARELSGFFGNLLARARVVHASENCKKNLADAALRELESTVQRSRDSRLRERAPLLTAVSHAAPEATLSAIESMVATVGATELVASPIADALCHGLRHISHRRICAPSFERLESLLFTLARTELAERRPQPVSLLFPRNSWAPEIWKSLFQPVTHLTRRPFEQRFMLLERRLDSSEPDERALAVDALVIAVGTPSGGWSAGWDDVDGPWEHEQRPFPDYESRLQLLWSALLDASSDPSEVVCRRARESIALELRHGVERGLTPTLLDQLAQLVSSWSIDERERLAEQVDDIVRHDLDSLQRRGPLAVAFKPLREAVQPSNLEERLVAQVGRWHPGPWPINVEDRMQLEQRRDIDLARELIAQPNLLAALVPWLTSAKAVRALQFAHALGLQDEPLHSLAVLRDKGHDLPSHKFIAAYLVGWLKAVGDASFDDWLDDARDHESPALLARVLTMAPANDHRVGLLLDLLRAREHSGEAMTGFGFFRPWAGQVSTEQLDRLLVEISKTEEPILTTEAIGLLETRLQRATVDLTSEVRATAHELLERQQGSLSSLVARSWWRSIFALVKGNDLLPLQHAIEQARSSIKYPHHIITALQEIAEARLADSTWPFIVELLDNGDDDDRRWLMGILGDARLFDALTPQLVLAWIGHDEVRALAVAEALNPLWSTAGELAQGLVARFGAGSSVGELLAPAMGELFDFGTWLSSEDPEVRRWASLRMADFTARSASGG